MTTFDDDFVRLNLATGLVNVPLKKLGLEWPPPDRIVDLLGSPLDPMVRVRMSVITDEQRASMTHVARGAEYVYEASQ